MPARIIKFPPSKTTIPRKAIHEYLVEMADTLTVSSREFFALEDLQKQAMMLHESIGFAREDAGGLRASEYTEWERDISKMIADIEAILDRCRKEAE